MAHQDIRRLTNELDAAKNNNLEASGMIQICISQRAVCSYLCIFLKISIKRLHEAYTGSLLMSGTELHVHPCPSFLVFLTRPVPHTSKQFFLTDS